MKQKLKVSACKSPAWVRGNKERTVMVCTKKDEIKLCNAILLFYAVLDLSISD